MRRAGLPAPPERAVRLARALALVPPADREGLYWTCRVTLVTDRAQLPLFDAVFSAVFDGRLDPADSRGDPTAPPSVGSEPRTRPAPPDSRPSDPTGGSADPRVAAPGPDRLPDGPERETVLAVASAQERLGETAFADLDDDELTEVRRLVARIVLATPERVSRRSRSARRGERLDLRRTIRVARRSGGDVERLVSRRRRRRPRRLVLLCDVSGSMEPYTRVFLTLLQGAVSAADAEAFVFSTGITRLTRQLAGRDVDAALARAAAVTSGWSGGTRLGLSIRQFLDDFGRRGMARGAVVVILSDGWATDDPADVADAMARLERVAHRVVWVNPRKAAPGFAPVVGGMAAALPYCDAFVSGHSLAALAEVAAAVGAERR